MIDKPTETITYERDANGIVTLTLDHPRNKQNVFDAQFADDFEGVVDRLYADEAATGAIIRSAKPVFMAGADLKELERLLFAVDRDLAAMRAGVERAKASMRRLELWPHPVAAAIRGHALGGGYELCLACNRRFAADESSILIGLPEVTVGLLPGGGGTQRLVRLIGAAGALPLLLDGTCLSPAAALERGLVDELVSAESLVEAARHWLMTRPEAKQPWDLSGFAIPGGSELRGGPLVDLFVAANAATHAKTRGNYPAPMAILATVYEGLRIPIDAALEIETDYFMSLLADPAAGNIVRTTFITRKAADGLVRRPDAPRFKVEKLGVIGAGLMGGGIAFAAADAGIEVVLLDRDDDLARRGKDYCRAAGEKRQKRMGGSPATDEALLGRIRTGSDFAALATADLVIEAVFEDESIKAEVIARAEQNMRPDAVFATNTSALPITALAHSFTRSGDFIGIHLFSPVERMPLVEIIRGKATSDTTLARAMDFVRQIRKTPIVVNDARGFYTSRCFGTFTDEGVHMLAEGVDPALIENGARMAGMPIGPLAVSDEVALDLVWKVIDTDLKTVPGYKLTAAGKVVDRMANGLGRLGRKTGGGFYEYPENQPKRLWKGLAKEFELSENQPPLEAVKNRFLYRQALEAARCMADGVIDHPADADLGAVLGWGFPAYMGGPLMLIDRMGLARFIEETQALADTLGPRFAPPDNLHKMACRGGSFYEPV